MSMIAAFQDNVPELPASGKARVAVLLLTLGAPGTSRLLKHFSASEIKLLKESAAGLQSVTPEQIAELVDEFQDAFKKAPGLDAPSLQMTNLLKESLSEEEFETIFSVSPGEGDDGAKAAERDSRNVWDSVAELQGEILAPRLSREHPHVVAVLLSKIRPDTAATVAREFDPAFRHDVMRRVLTLKSLTRPVQRLLEVHLRQAYLASPDRGEQQSSHTILADIVNRMSKSHADDLIVMLDQTSPKDAEKLRNLLFAFDDIVALDKRARMVLFDAIDTEVIITAFVSASDELKEAALSSLSARSRRMVEAEFKRGDEKPAADIDRARRQVASTALELWSQGKLDLHGESEA